MEYSKFQQLEYQGSAYDVEYGRLSAQSSLDNETVQTLTWKALNVTVKDRKTGRPRPILSSCDGHIEAGQVIALMGPSGSGKTTLLNVLANRSQLPYNGEILINNAPATGSEVQKLSNFVEQDDALIGSLTVAETVDFTSRLGYSGLTRRQRIARNTELIAALGLQHQRNTIVGTPLRKGISGGQKRRLSVATQLLAGPKILFLDEPTSGLDSVASYEVMKFICQIAKRHRLIVIASIHQPSTSTFALFDSILLLAQGRTCYFGARRYVADYFSNFCPIPLHTNPAEFLLELVNTDFVQNTKDVNKVDLIMQRWQSSQKLSVLRKPLPHIAHLNRTADYACVARRPMGSQVTIPLVLLQRNFIKSYRDFLAYGTRVAMYAGLAIMMGTVWLRLPYVQSSIQPFINAIFFGGAFMSFMAVAYVPSVTEDIYMLRKEYANGLYGALSFSVANFLIGVPWLFAITMVFSILTYWLCNFYNTAGGFWIWVLFLFLDLLAAESLVVLVSAITFNFVVALAVTAFANGLWMAVGGFLVPLGTLNAFWKYVFHYIDYQAYVFNGMMVNQFKHTTYACDRVGDAFQCMYPSGRQDKGSIEGTAVLGAYKISHHDGILGQSFGIMIAIILVYRVLGFAALHWRARTK